MGKPTSPQTVILKNKFYPKGLREIDVWFYYQSVKRELIAENVGLQMMVYIMTDLNKPVIRRKGAGGKPIYLDNKSYDNVVTGRTISFHSSMNPTTRYGIIDVDIHPNDGFRWAKQATLATYDYVMDKMPVVRGASIVYTGKTSFHVVCNFNQKMKIDTMRFMLQKFLRNFELARVYTIEQKRRRGVPNLDLSPNKVRGNFITLNSLSILGLKCMEVPYNKLNSFDPRMARIK